MLVKLMLMVRYALGGTGLYVSISLLNSDLPRGIAIASLTAVGAVGVLSFVSHVCLHAADAEQIGFKAVNPDFQYEVGFANLGIGLAAVISFFGNWGLAADTVIILAYGLYMFQAGALHLYRSRGKKSSSRANLVRAIPTFVFSGSMLYIVVRAVQFGF